MRLSNVIHYIIVIIVSVSSVLQFHHHDCNGDIFIQLPVHALDIPIGTPGHSIIQCKHESHNDNCHNHSKHCNEGCGMHLNDYVTERLTSLDDNLTSVTLNNILFNLVDFLQLSDIELNSIKLPYRVQRVTEYHGFNRLSGLRAPPSMHA